MACCDRNSSAYITGIEDNQDIYLQYEESEEKLTWCSGCGNYGIQKAVFRAMTLENIPHDKVLFCYDIGCSGNESDKIGAFTIHGLHGRVLPLAAGAVIANNRLKVIAVAGDGATFSEGVNHLMHTVRNDYPIVFLCHNNENYGLTTGQASSTTRKGFAMNGSPDGAIADPINVCRLVLSLNPTFVARCFSGDVKHMTEIIRKGLKHNGFAFIEIMQVCPTYNRATSQKWFWDRLHYLDDDKAYDASDILQAQAKADDLENEIAMGIIYQNPKANFIERLPQRLGISTVPTEEVRSFAIDPLLAEFR